MFFSFLSALMNSIDSVLVKTLVNKRGYKETLVFTMLFASIFSIFPLINHWKLSISIISFFILTILICIQLTTFFIYNKIVVNMEVYKLEIYVRGYLIVALIIDTFLGSFKLNYYNSLGILLFFIAIIILIKDGNSSNEHKKLSFRTYAEIFLCLILWAIKPFFIKYGFNHNNFNNQTFMFINFTSVASIYYIIYRPKLLLDSKTLKQYSGQAISKYLTGILFNMALISAPVTLVSIASSTNIFITALLSFLFLKSKITKKQIIAIVLAFASVCLILIK